MFFRQHENYKLNGVGASSTCTNTMDLKSIIDLLNLSLSITGSNPVNLFLGYCLNGKAIKKNKLKIKDKALTIKDIVLNFIDKSLNKQSTKIDKILDNSLSLSLIGA